MVQFFCLTVYKCRLPAEVIGSISYGNKKLENTEKIVNVKKDLHQRGSDIQQTAKCIKDRKLEEICPRSSILINCMYIADN